MLDSFLPKHCYMNGIKVHKDWCSSFHCKRLLLLLQYFRPIMIDGTKHSQKFLYKSCLARQPKSQVNRTNYGLQIRNVEMTPSEIREVLVMFIGHRRFWA